MCQSAKVVCSAIVIVGELPVLVTLEIEDEKKAKLDRFVASLLLQENINVTAQEALGLMIDYAVENEEELIRRIKESQTLTDDSAWKAPKNQKQRRAKVASKMEETLYEWWG